MPKLNKTVASGPYRHPVIGAIRVRVVATAKGLRAHWQGPELLISVPKDYPLDFYNRFVEENIDRFLELKPMSAFWLGQVIDGFPVDFTIMSAPDSSIGGRGIYYCLDKEQKLRGKEGNYFLKIAQSLVDDGIDHPATQKLINRAMLKAAGRAVEIYIIPRAHELADIVGQHPSGWDVKYKKRSLGTCDQNGIISLNPRLIFLPPHLRDFVIFHELAHLSEMNHSPRFHALCNQYCGGHEKELNAELKAFHFIVI